jgi:hypothetical protein
MTAWVHRGDRVRHREILTSMRVYCRYLDGTKIPDLARRFFPHLSPAAGAAKAKRTIRMVDRLVGRGTIGEGRTSRRDRLLAGFTPNAHLASCPQCAVATSVEGFCPTGRAFVEEGQREPLDGWDLRFADESERATRRVGPL